LKQDLSGVHRGLETLGKTFSESSRRAGLVGEDAKELSERMAELEERLSGFAQTAQDSEKDIMGGLAVLGKSLEGFHQRVNDNHEKLTALCPRLDKVEKRFAAKHDELSRLFSETSTTSEKSIQELREYVDAGHQKLRCDVAQTDKTTTLLQDSIAVAHTKADKAMAAGAEVAADRLEAKDPAIAYDRRHQCRALAEVFRDLIADVPLVGNENVIRERKKQLLQRLSPCFNPADLQAYDFHEMASPKHTKYRDGSFGVSTKRSPTSSPANKSGLRPVHPKTGSPRGIAEEKSELRSPRFSPRSEPLNHRRPPLLPEVLPPPARLPPVDHRVAIHPCSDDVTHSHDRFAKLRCSLGKMRLSEVNID